MIISTSTQLTVNIDNLPDNYQWGRLRLISRFRPFAKSWKLANTNFNTATNLVIMSSGINFDHIEFQNVYKKTNLFTLAKFKKSYLDDVGDGTAIASYAAGSNIGINQYVNLMNCKISSATYQPTPADISNALDAIYKAFKKDSNTPMVVNIGWTIPKNTDVEQKIQTMIDAGIGFVCAAGDSGIDISTLTPAGMKDVITVAASDLDDVSAGFNNFSFPDAAFSTNFGENIDIFSPGVDCIGADFTATNLYSNFNGTSISAGYVSGCLATIMSLIPNIKYNDARNILIDYATAGALLLDLDQFSYSQNLIPYNISSMNAMTLNSSTFYLGYLTANSPCITGDINMMMNVARYSTVTNEIFNYGIIPNDSSTTSILDGCVEVKSNGEFLINNPEISWNPNDSIKLFEFQISATSTSNSITFVSPNLIFFATNPDNVDNMISDLSSALEKADAQSFFATVAPLALK